MTTNKPYSNEISKIDKINQLSRKRERNERKERQKNDNYWVFLAGTLVAKYLKDDLNIQIYKGKDAKTKNADSFAPLENILKYLAANKEFTARIASGENVESPIVIRLRVHIHIDEKGGVFMWRYMVSI